MLNGGALYALPILAQLKPNVFYNLFIQVSAGRVGATANGVQLFSNVAFSQDIVAGPVRVTKKEGTSY